MAKKGFDFIGGSIAEAKKPIKNLLGKKRKSKKSSRKSRK